MKNDSVSSVLTRCQEQRCKLTRGWENINHAIQPGCVRWEQPTFKENNAFQTPTYVSPFPASVSADDWVPEVEEDDTPPLTSDSEDSDSDSDSEDEKLPAKKTTIKSTKFKIGQQSKSSFNCPVSGCPKNLSKPWKNVASLHSHLADHCAGKYQGSVPSQYFKEWNKEFCPNCCQMRKSFSPSSSCCCCLRKKSRSTNLPPSTTLSSALPHSPNLSQPNNGFDLRTQSDEEVFASHNFSELPSIEVIVKLRSPTLKFVPKRIRSEWSLSLIHI